MGFGPAVTCTPGGPFYSGFSLGEMGLSDSDIAAVTGVGVIVQRNAADDPAVVVTVLPLAGPAGRYAVSGTIPVGYGAGDTLILWARVTTGGGVFVFRFDLFTVLDVRARNLLDVATGVSLILRSLQAS